MRVGRFNAVRASALLLATFVAVVLVEHLLRRDLAPRDHRISEYANGSEGWVMMSAFVAWAASLAGTAIGIARGPLRPRRCVRALVGLFLVTALGAAVTAMCKTGTSAGVVPPGRELTAANHAHDIGSAILALALWATIAAGLALSDRPSGWRGLLSWPLRSSPRSCCQADWSRRQVFVSGRSLEWHARGRPCFCGGRDRLDRSSVQASAWPRPAGDGGRLFTWA